MIGAVTKTCRDCNVDKPLTDYYAHKATKDRRQAFCKSCMQIRNRNWRARNPEKLAAYERSRPRRPHHVRRAEQLRREYNIEPAQYDAMVTSQGGRCAICGEIPPAVNGKKVNLFVDHCHDTNKVRGLLCSGCNVALGHMKDDVSRLRAAIAYLEERNAD